MILESTQVQEVKCKVTLQGKEYPLEGGLSKEQLEFIEKYLNNKFDELRQNAPMIPMGRLAMLLCVNLANELYEQRYQFTNKLNHYDAAITEVVSTLDTVL
ncbi:cell division protein ZapA [bacterium]|nr:cell division protein ZapA [bacterium]MCP5462391.1 cell division protein ZapA [bacterium]